MVLTEKLSYYAGELFADFVFLTFMPTSGFAVYKVVLRFNSFAKSHSLVEKSLEAVSDNLFKCLPYID